MTWYKDKFFWYIFTALSAVKAAAFIYICFFHPSGESVLALPDSIGYVYPAQTLLQEGSMWEAVSVSPMLLRTPGYPLFLAAVQLATHSMTWGVALWQNILSLLMLIPVYLSAGKLGGKNAARWATFFCAASILYFSLAFAVLTEPLCAFLLAWFVFFILRFFQAPHTRDLLGAALLLAAAVYVRPAAYYFMPVCAVILLCFCASKWLRCSIRKVLIAFVLPLFIAIGAWHIRNATTAQFSGFTTVDAYNLYVWNEDYLAHQLHVPAVQAHELITSLLPQGFADWPAKEQVRFYKTRGAQLVQKSFLYKLAHAPLWAAKTLLGTNFAHTAHLLNLTPLQTAGGEPTGALPAGWTHSFGSVVLLLFSVGQVGLTVLLGAAGLWILWKQKRAEAFFLLIYCLYFWGIGSVFYGAYARFRAPFEFVLCICAGLAAAELLSLLPKKLKPGRQTVD